MKKALITILDCLLLYLPLSSAFAACATLSSFNVTYDPSLDTSTDWGLKVSVGTSGGNIGGSGCGLVSEMLVVVYNADWSNSYSTSTFQDLSRGELTWRVSKTNFPAGSIVNFQVGRFNPNFTIRCGDFQTIMDPCADQYPWTTATTIVGAPSSEDGKDNGDDNCSDDCECVKTTTSNPINIATGNMSHKEVDFDFGELRLERWYNSKTTLSKKFGSNWAFVFGEYVVDLSQTGYRRIIGYDGKYRYYLNPWPLLIMGLLMVLNPIFPAKARYFQRM